MILLTIAREHKRLYESHMTCRGGPAAAPLLLQCWRPMGPCQQERYCRALLRCCRSAWRMQRGSKSVSSAAARWRDSAFPLIAGDCWSTRLVREPRSRSPGWGSTLSSVVGGSVVCVGVILRGTTSPAACFAQERLLRPPHDPGDDGTPSGVINRMLESRGVKGVRVSVVLSRC
jgi:hypothetical protein